MFLRTEGRELPVARAFGFGGPVVCDPLLLDPLVLPLVGEDVTSFSPRPRARGSDLRQMVDSSIW